MFVAKRPILLKAKPLARDFVGARKRVCEQNFLMKIKPKKEAMEIETITALKQ